MLSCRNRKTCWNFSECMCAYVHTHTHPIVTWSMVMSCYDSITSMSLISYIKNKPIYLVTDCLIILVWSVSLTNCARKMYISANQKLKAKLRWKIIILQLLCISLLFCFCVFLFPLLLLYMLKFFNLEDNSEIAWMKLPHKVDTAKPNHACLSDEMLQLH